MELTAEQIAESNKATEIAFGKKPGIPKDASNRPTAKIVDPPKVNTGEAPLVAPVVTPVVPEPPKADVVPNTEAVVAPDPPKVDYDSMSDEDFDKMIAKRTKGAVKSLADLAAPPVRKTAEEIAEAEAKEKEDSLAWAISSGKIKKTDYDKSLTEKGKSKRDIAMQLFTAEAKEENPKVTSEEVEEAFKDFYGEDLDADSPMKAKRLKLMERTADNYLAQFSNVDKIYDEYKDHLSRESNKSQIGKQIDAVFDTLPSEMKFSIPYTHADGTTQNIDISYAIDDADLSAIKRQSKKDALQVLSNLGVNAKEIKDEFILNGINQDIRAKVFDKVITKVMTDAAEKAKTDTLAWAKAIPVRQPEILGNEQPKAGKIREWTEKERQAMPKSSYGR